jgi:2-C-methyl-D-erythritol 4-phosphate cytidylyltransferase
VTLHPIVTAVILAGGSGERFGSPVVKQFLDLAGRPMLAHALLAFEQSPRVTATVVVLPRERPAFVDDELTGFPKVWSVTDGGPTRQASLGEGLICLPDGTDIVLVHDAARPAVQLSLIARVIGGLDDAYDGAGPALPVEDAL